MKLQQTLFELQLTPFSLLLGALLEQLQEKDQARVFAQPVDVGEVRRHTATHCYTLLHTATPWSSSDTIQYRSDTVT